MSEPILLRIDGSPPSPASGRGREDMPFFPLPFTGEGGLPQSQAIARGEGSLHHLTPEEKMRRDVSLPASRLHAKGDGEFVRHDAGSLRPPPVFTGFERSFWKRSDFRPHDRLSPIHVGRHARAPGPGRQQHKACCSLWVNCGKPRLGRSTQGV